MSFVTNLPDCPQLRLPNRPEKIDLQFQSCESFAFIECGGISDAHGCIGYATKNAAMTYTHRIRVLFTVLEFNDSLSASDGRELKSRSIALWVWGIPLSMAWNI